jgi:hypothetical protein
MQLFITEKPSIGKLILDLADNKNQTSIIYTMSHGLFSPKMPKDLCFNDIPATPTVKEDELSPYYRNRDIQWIKNGVQHQNGVTDILLHLNTNARRITEVIIATDNDRVGAYAGLQLLEKINVRHDVKVTCMPLYSFLKPHLQQSYEARRSLGQTLFPLWSKQEYLKRTFDFWWKINAQLVFGELCKASNLKGDPIISKYELMLLYFLSSQDTPVSSSDILDWMNKPPTRKEYAPLIMKFASIGSTISQTHILETAKARGAFSVSYGTKTTSGRRQECYLLSQPAQKFMTMLHKKSDDLELPFRLLTWINVDIPDLHSSEISIRRYINQFFGRQLRYQRKIKH